VNKSKSIWKRSIMAGLAATILASGINMAGVSQVEAKAIPQIFDFEAHRGGRDARPENTLVAFAYAMELGVPEQPVPYRY